jgi:hypothetical protein
MRSERSSIAWNDFALLGLVFMWLEILLGQVLFKKNIYNLSMLKMI